jgi:hypothetical protein
MMTTRFTLAIVAAALCAALVGCAGSHQGADQNFQPGQVQPNGLLRNGVMPQRPGETS